MCLTGCESVGVYSVSRSLSGSCTWICCFKQKTAYEMRISDGSSDVCSSDLAHAITHSFPRRAKKTAPAEAGTVVGCCCPKRVTSGFLRPRRAPPLGLDRVTREQRAGSGAGARRAREELAVGAIAPGLEVRVFRREIGRASCRERVFQYGMVLVVRGHLKKKCSKTRQ